MAMVGKVYEVLSADENDGSKIAPGVFPGTLAGLVDALDAARCRSAADTPKVVVIVEGKRRQTIRRFEAAQKSGRRPRWTSAATARTASRAESARESGRVVRGYPPPWPVCGPADHHHELAALPGPAWQRPGHHDAEPPGLPRRAEYLPVQGRRPVLEHAPDLPPEAQPGVPDGVRPHARPAEVDGRRGLRSQGGSPPACQP